MKSFHNSEVNMKPRPRKLKKRSSEIARDRSPEQKWGLERWRGLTCGCQPKLDFMKLSRELYLSHTITDYYSNNKTSPQTQGQHKLHLQLWKIARALTQMRRLVSGSLGKKRPGQSKACGLNTAHWAFKSSPQDGSRHQMYQIIVESLLSTSTS